MPNQNLIDKPFMSTTQWISVCAAMVIGTNAVNLVVARVEKVEIAQATLHELHVKDFEILLHKMSAQGGRTNSDLKDLWEEFNKLKENHETID